MIRLFKHYIPHAVVLLWLVDLAVLFSASEFAWRIRAGQIGIEIGPLANRWVSHAGFVTVMTGAMIAVGVYGSDSLRSLRFAGARLLVAISIGVIALSFIDFLLAGDNFWRSTLAYSMVLSVMTRANW